MRNDIVCPKCNSADVIFSKKRQVYICEEEGCRHEFLPEKERPHLRIFISYGRDEYAALAERLKADLSRRGHEVWFDSERLKEGGDWERYIEEGINHVARDISTGRVVFIMTPHSTRRPDGYCLNELARALSRSLPIVPLMLVYSEPPLSICRLQYLDMQDSYPPDKNAVTYEQRFERLVLALEENRLDFEGFQGRLLAALDPIKFHADIQKLLRDFTGRRWVIEAVDKWNQDPNGSKIFWLTGAPGTGKSAVAAWIRDNRREIAAYHFCDFNSEEKRSASKLVRSISYQLSTQLPQYEEKLKSLPVQEIANEYKEAYTLFDKLIVQPLAENFPDPGRTVVVLIDALDEATYKGNNEIVLFLARCADKTPSWMRFLVTSRPEQEIISSLQALSPYLLDTDTEANRNDIREYLKIQLPIITAEQTDQILERSEGVFLYVKHVCEEIKAKRLSLDRTDMFPKGLGDVYKQFFENRIPADRLDYYKQDIRPLLCAVFASFEPLTLGHLMRLLGKNNLMEIFDVTDMLGSLFPRTGDSEQDTISPFHRSIKDWITVKASSGVYFVDEKYGHQILAQDGWTQYKNDVDKMDDYGLAWLPLHLAEVDEYDKLLKVLKDFDYMMARVKAGHLERMFNDYRETVISLPFDHRQQVRIEEAFFRERAHILRRGDKDWPSYKILLQLAIEHADDSPVTQGAEQYLSNGKCGWIWLRRGRRVKDSGDDPCVAVLEGHTSYVNGALNLRDGRIISWSVDKTLRLWDRDGQPLSVLSGHTDSIKGAIELSNGRIISWSVDKTLRLWDRGGQPLSVLSGHTDSVKGAIELGDGRIVSWSVDKTLRLWDRDGQLLSVLSGHTGSVKGAIELGDGRIISWSVDKTLRLWDRDGQPLSVLQGHTDSVNGAIELSNGRILSWSWDYTLRLWDNREGQPLSVLKGHTRPVVSVIELYDGRILSWCWDKTLRLWDREGQPLFVLNGHKEDVLGALELNDGNILSWSKDSTLRQWDREGQPLAVMEGHTYSVNGALNLRYGRILSWARDKTLRLWDRGGQPLSVLKGHTHSVNGVIELSDGHVLSWGDYSLRLWNMEDQPLTALEGHTEHAHGVIELRDGRFLSGSQDNTLRLWDMEGHPLSVLKGHASLLSGTGAIELDDGRILSWSNNDQALRLWDRDGQPLAVLEGHAYLVNGATELSNGRILSWAGDNTLRLWDREGQPLFVLKGHTESVVGAFELRDARFLSWSIDHTLRLWDREGQPLSVLKGHEGLSYNAGAIELGDGRILSWSYKDQELRLWDRDGQPLSVLKGHDRVKGAFELGDGRILSWSWDESIRLWKQNGEPLGIYDRYEGLRLYPEVKKAYFGEGRVVSNTYLDGSVNSSFFRFFGNHTETFIVWHGVSNCMPCLLKSDGHTVVTQDNGQVCFLKLYDGNRRITLDELEAKLATPG